MLTIREVLFPTDLSPESDRAFEHARLLAERFLASLTLYHAVEVPDHRFAHWAFAHNHEIWQYAEKQARECLQRRAESLLVSHRVIVERKVSAHRAIAELMRELQPDLTVLATHGREGLSHLLLGSVAEKVMQHAFRPVLCVREPDHGPALSYRRILVPTDLSVASRQAFPLAALFARTFEAEVLAVHVRRDRRHGAFTEPVSEEDVVRFFEPDFAEVRVTPRVLEGVVWDRVVATAREERIDLIVMSTHGHDSLADRIVGSSTERVVRHASCPVLVS